MEMQTFSVMNICFSVQASQKTVSYGGKNLGFGGSQTLKKPSFWREFQLPKQ